MVGQRISDEEKIIKKMDALGNCNKFDVKATVMERVRAIHGGQNSIDGEMTSIISELKPFPEPGDPVMQKQEKILPHPSRYKKRLLSGVSAAILLGIIGFGVLQLPGLGDLMEQGSHSTIEITKSSDGDITLVNSGGKTVVQTVHINPPPAPSTSPAIEKYLSILETYEEQALAHLNAGEMAAYYVNDTEFIKFAKGLGYGNQLQFAFASPVYSNYQEFVKELKAAGDFWPELPSALADSYEFEQGTFKAYFPDKDIDKEYQELLKLFQNKAKADTTGQKLFMKKIAVNAVESAEVIYHKGDQTIELSLSQSTYMGGISQVSILEGQTAEKWSLTGTGKEAVFIAASPEEGAQTWASLNLLYWYDEASQTIRSLNDKPNNKLTREQWQMIATSFIR